MPPIFLYFFLLPPRYGQKNVTKIFAVCHHFFNIKWSVIVSLTQQLLHSVQSLGMLLPNQLVEPGVRNSKNFLPSPVYQTDWASMMGGCASFESQMFSEKTPSGFPMYNEAEAKRTECLLFNLRVISQLRLNIFLKSKKRENQTPFTLCWFWLG